MQVDLWEIIKVALIPIAIIAFGLIWRRIDKNEMAANVRMTAIETEGKALRDQMHAASLEYERRYINWKTMDDFKLDIFKRFDRLEKALDRALPADRE
jgi:hypothetical protein